MKKVYVGGYAGSGSGAVVDFFKECSACKTLDFEQRFIVDPDGLMSLCLTLNSSPTPYEVDLAVRRFLNLIDNLCIKYSWRSYAGYQLPSEADLSPSLVPFSR